MGLIVDREKTKYMVMSRQVTPKSNLKVYGYSFKQVKEFKYLVVNINEKNNMHDEIKTKLMMASKIYYAMKEMFISKLLSRQLSGKVIHNLFATNSDVCMRDVGQHKG
jgi:hypothetical protein